MSPLKTFKVFGEEVEILVSGEMSRGGAAVLTQTSPPGGGPPVHSHTFEDETFTVLEGEFEFFDGTSWTTLLQGQVAFGPRGSVHGFRNSGTVDGKILVVAAPAGMDKYLEQISSLSIPADLPELQTISEQFGIRFL